MIRLALLVITCCVIGGFAFGNRTDHKVFVSAIHTDGVITRSQPTYQSITGGGGAGGTTVIYVPATCDQGHEFHIIKEKHE